MPIVSKRRRLSWDRNPSGLRKISPSFTRVRLPSAPIAEGSGAQQLWAAFFRCFAAKAPPVIWVRRCGRDPEKRGGLAGRRLVRGGTWLPWSFLQGQQRDRPLGWPALRRRDRHD